jgi:hypothetical protein
VRAARKLAVRLREQGIKVSKSTIAEWVSKWDEERAVAQTLPDQFVSAIAKGQSLAAVEESLAMAAAEVTRRLRAGGDIKVLTRSLQCARWLIATSQRGLGIVSKPTCSSHRIALSAPRTSPHRPPMQGTTSWRLRHSRYCGARRMKKRGGAAKSP